MSDFSNFRKYVTLCKKRVCIVSKSTKCTSKLEMGKFEICERQVEEWVKLKSGWNLDLKGKLKSEFWGEEVVGEKDCADWLDFDFFLTPNGSGSDLTFLKYHTEGCPLFKFVDIYEGGGSVLKGFPWPPPRL